MVAYYMANRARRDAADVLPAGLRRYSSVGNRNFGWGICKQGQIPYGGSGSAAGQPMRLHSSTKPICDCIATQMRYDGARALKPKFAMRADRLAS